MTDEEGVEDRYQPTKSNLVRNFSQPLPTSTNPNNAFFQEREIKALSRQVQPGGRRVFYCTDLPSQHSISSTLIMSQMPVTLNRCPPRRVLRKIAWTRVCILSLLICLHTLSAVASALVVLGGLRIRDNVRILCRSACCNVQILTSFRRLRIGW